MHLSTLLISATVALFGTIVVSSPVSRPHGYPTTTIDTFDYPDAPLNASFRAELESSPVFNESAPTNHDLVAITPMYDHSTHRHISTQLGSSSKIAEEYLCATSGASATHAEIDVAYKRVVNRIPGFYFQDNTMGSQCTQVASWKNAQISICGYLFKIEAFHVAFAVKRVESLCKKNGRASGVYYWGDDRCMVLH